MWLQLFCRGFAQARGVCGGLCRGFAAARGVHMRATAGGLARRARAQPASAASAWRKTALFSVPFLASKKDPFWGSPLCGLSSCLPRPLGSLFRGRRCLRLQARVSPGVCALRVSVSGAMEFRAFPDFGFDADDSDVEEEADTERPSKRIKFHPWEELFETPEEAFHAWWVEVSVSGPSVSSCSSDHSDMSVDSETEYWSNAARLSLLEEEEETAYLAGLLDEDVVHTDIAEEFFSAAGPDERAGRMGPAPVTGAGTVA